MYFLTFAIGVEDEQSPSLQRPVVGCLSTGPRLPVSVWTLLVTGCPSYREFPRLRGWIRNRFVLHPFVV